MPHTIHAIALSGVISHVFGHRFTVDTGGEIHLADLGPKGVQAFPLMVGMRVDLEGERRPSEIKVTRIASPGREAVPIGHDKPTHAKAEHAPQGPADPEAVAAAVAAAGWSVAAPMRRKPKHFEVLARKEGRPATELHVDFGGRIYKEKGAEPSEWDGVA